MQVFATSTLEPDLSEDLARHVGGDETDVRAPSYEEWARSHELINRFPYQMDE